MDYSKNKGIFKNLVKGLTAEDTYKCNVFNKTVLVHSGIPGGDLRPKPPASNSKAEHSLMLSLFI